MKVYKKFNGMSKKAKAALIGTTLYAATLALPVYAAVEQTGDRVVKTVDVDNLQTLDQLNVLYKTKIEEYSADKLLVPDEMDNLYIIESKRKEILKEKITNLNYTYTGAKSAENEITSIDAEIEKINTLLENKEKPKIFSEIDEEISEKILKYYPALFDKDNANVVYSAEDMIEDGLNGPFKEILIKSDKALKNYYNDNSLEIFLNKDKFRINHVLALYKIINNKEDLYNQEKIEEFNKKIADLEEQKSGLIRANQELFALKGEVDSLEKKIKQNDQFITTYQIYFQFREGIKDFEEKYGNFSKQLLIGPIKREFLNQEGLNKGDIESESRIFSSIEETLHDYFGLYFSQEGYKNLKVDMPGNPAKPLIPFWLGLTSVLVFPIVRNMLLRKYVKGKADDEIEYLLSGCAGMFNGFAGAIFCGLPYCLPALMLSPLILQPFFKLTKFDPIDEMIK